MTVDEEKLASPDILQSLAQKFSSKPVNKRSNDVIDKYVGECQSHSTANFLQIQAVCFFISKLSFRGGTLKKVKSLRVLDSKVAQNLSILLGGPLKPLKYEDVKKSILRCDVNVLSANLLEQLISYLPPEDQLKRLQQFKNDYDDLTEAEQFALTVSVRYYSANDFRLSF